MPVIITIKDIEEALDSLNYKSETTLKRRLIHAIRNFYVDDNSIETLTSIDTEEIIKSVWQTGDDPACIKNKRKNFSSTKSGVNSDLKKLYQEGKNPLGIIIGAGNVFDISNEAKNKALSSVADIFREKGLDSSNKITEILDALNNISIGSLPAANTAEAREEISRLRSIINELSNRFDLPEAKITVPDKTGLQESEVKADKKTEFQSSTESAEENISSPPNEQGHPLPALINNIPDTLNQIIATGLNDEVIQQIQSLFGTLTNKIQSALASGQGLDHITVALAKDETGDEIIEAIDETGLEEIVEVVEETSADLPVEEALPEEVESAAAEELLPEGVPAETQSGSATVEEMTEALPEESAAIIEEAMPEDSLEELADAEITEEAEEIIEELMTDEEEIAAQQDNIAIDAASTDLETQAEILAELAAAAQVLEKIGPDLTNSIYSEEEIREKAKLLSEEFDRYLSIREKFYNQHILIKEGNYPVGRAAGRSDENRKATVNLREFYIGKFPVTNALFEIFVEKTGYVTTAEKYGFGMVHIPRMQKIKNALSGTESFVWNSQLQHKKVPGACWYRPGGPDSTLYIKRTHPVVQVSLEDACAFAAWTGKRIPTEAEWEASARTSRGYLYPWGNDWQDDACNLEKSLLGDTSPVDMYLKYSNEYEVTDTLGNILEWTLDPWRESEPEEDEEENYVAKGASWISDYPVGLTDRQPIYKNYSSNILGFRCIAI